MDSVRSGKKYSEKYYNDLKVSEKPKLKYLGFTYNGAKLFNMLPFHRENKNLNTFKSMTRLDMEQHSFISINFFIAVL